ncbi:hypothetical protein [Egicoccus halophilus]|uniref:Uncharacterized protein n=1 Tax=Egicoccus halophilus TaxID=1670830 RepID=A0A8J3ESW7_9ACTN|nr:hypothetical protein [Egicoccus halophilus]GGI04365.1 hypothetical protein GCM10011354_08730 [Egicoccus halophilus]
MSTPHQDQPEDGRSNGPKDHPENRDDAGRRPGMHPEAQRSGTAGPGTLVYVVGALVLGLLVYLLVGAGIIGN